ncbi:SgcJ/EcaC family oxidoreductase [Nostocales cyanobacterium LEGE 11386]|nr:SgcJ/EcaC family oxidoreductase [Nostocales cyanobacterium LEGE 11386]
MKIKTLALVVAPIWIISLSTLVIAQQQTKQEQCVKTSKTEVEQLFERWNQSLQTGDPNNVVKNYAKNAILLPTVSKKPRTTPAEIREYFVHFLEKQPVGKIVQSYIRVGCNFASNNGLYTFTILNNEQKKQVPARYSFEYQYINGQWLIVAHHSSKLPQED